MQLADLLKEILNMDCDGVCKNECTPTPVRVFERLFAAIDIDSKLLLEIDAYGRRGTE